jgi:hypothetical protein
VLDFSEAELQALTQKIDDASESGRAEFDAIRRKVL